jgi:hypothetical protein
MLNRVICGNDILAHAKSLAIKALYIKWKPLSQLKRLTLTDFLESDEKVSSNFLGMLHTGATTAPSFSPSRAPEGIGARICQSHPAASGRVDASGMVTIEF